MLHVIAAKFYCGFRCISLLTNPLVHFFAAKFDNLLHQTNHCDTFRQIIYANHDAQSKVQTVCIKTFAMIQCLSYLENLYWKCHLDLQFIIQSIDDEQDVSLITVRVIIRGVYFLNGPDATHHDHIVKLPNAYPLPFVRIKISTIAWRSVILYMRQSAEAVGWNWRWTEVASYIC
jgi:hypothetical protein